MGQSQSSQPPPKAPTIVQYDALPASAAIGGIGVGGKTQGCRYCSNPKTCGPCKLFIAQGISASSVKMYRESGNVSLEQCSQFVNDLKLVDENKLAFDQLKKNLIDGKYFRDLQNGYCAQLYVKPGEESKIVDKATLTNDRLITPAIRKRTPGGGYSSTTKLFLKPSIPFRITLNGTTADIATMTLFHPSPLRIENVQHDAVLTLNDVADSSANLVVLIPLVGSAIPKEGGRFISKIASYVPGVLQPNPATNQYESVDVPTGSDWNLTTLFPGVPDPATKQTMVVNSGFFTWKASPPVVEYVKGTVKNPSPNADILQMGWKPATGVVGPTFVMLETPIEINAFDLQTIRMLPMTPSQEAMPPPLLDTVTYTAKASCGAGGLLSGKKESFTVANPESGPKLSAADCDPFAAMQPVSTITKDDIFAAVMGVLTAIAMFVGLYYALKYASDNNWGTKIQSWGRQFGKYLATAPPPGADTAPAPAPAAPTTGPVRAAPTRQGEDFAFTNEAAMELRRRKKAEQEEMARLKKEADEAAAKAKAEESAEMERLRKEAEANATEAKEQEAAQMELLRKQAEEAEARMSRPAETGPSKAVPTRTGEDFAFVSPLAERKRQKREEQAEMARLKKEAEEAAGTGLLSREELEANTERARKEAEEIELARLRAEANDDAREAKADEARAARIAARKQMTPLEKAQEDLKLARNSILSNRMSLNEWEGNLGTAKEYYERMKKTGSAELIASAKKSMEDTQARVDSIRDDIAKAEAEVETLRKKIDDLKAEPKALKRRTIVSSDRQLTTEEEPPTPKEDPKKKADIDAKLKALQARLVEIEERKQAAKTTVRNIISARNKARTLRVSPPKVPSQTEREIERLKTEADQLVKEAETNAGAAEADAKRNQSQANALLEMAKKYSNPEVEKKIAETKKKAEELEAEAIKSKEDAEAEREKVARDLAAAQSRLRQSQMLYNRTTQRRNLTTGKGRTQRNRKH